MKKNFVFFLLICLNVSSFSQHPLQAGPMLGYSDLREVAIWVQTTQQADVKINYWLKGNSVSISSTNTVTTSTEKAYTAVLLASNVEPGNTYEYQLVINDKAIELNYPTEFQTQPVWKWRTEPPNFTLATGSCAYINEELYDRPGTPYGGEYEIFNAIYKSNPDLMLWLGDNTYLREPDWNTWTGITMRWTHTRSTTEMQPLLASTHNYAIWDDHDFGPNNSDRGFWNKNKTLEAFELFWGNPSYGVGDIRGAITQFQWNDVDFILLDNRFHRSPNNLKAENKTILGEAQKQWLKDVLVSSSGSFKIIAVGGQFLNNAGRPELFSETGFDKERQEIIDFIYRHNIKNVVFLTGDRHHTELSILKEPGNPKIIDLTVSALTSGPAHNANENNTLRVDGTYVDIRNYGLITFAGTLKERVLKIEIRDSTGELIWRKEIQVEE